VEGDDVMVTPKGRDDCLFTEVGAYLNTEYTRLVKSRNNLKARLGYLTTKEVWTPKVIREMAGIAGEQLANSSLSKAIIAKSEQALMKTAFQLTDSMSKTKISGNLTVGEAFAKSKDLIVSSSRIVQMILASPLFMIGLVKMNFDELNKKLDKELLLLAEMETKCRELSNIVGTPVGQEVIDQIMLKATSAALFLKEAESPLASSIAKIITSNGNLKHDLELARSNIVAAKSVFTQDFSQAKSDVTISNLQIGKVLGDNFKESLWGELAQPELDKLNTLKDDEVIVWSDYIKLVKLQAEVRKTLFGIDGISQLILHGSQTFNLDLNESLGINESMKQLLEPLLKETLTRVKSLEEDLSYYSQNPNELNALDLGSKYPDWIAELLLINSFVTNSGFDLASGWIATSNDNVEDYDKLMSLSAMIDTFEGNDPSSKFFTQLNSFHLQFPAAVVGKGSLTTVTGELLKTIREYRNWMYSVKSMTTIKFKNYEDFKIVLDFLQKINADGMVAALKNGDITGLVGLIPFAGGWIDVVITCLHKKYQEANDDLTKDAKARAEQKRIINSLLAKLKSYKLREKKGMSEEAKAIMNHLTFLNEDLKNIEVSLKNLVQFTAMGVLTVTGDISPMETAAITAAMYDPEEQQRVQDMEEL
jgi:hypothetical protein